MFLLSNRFIYSLSNRIFTKNTEKKITANFNRKKSSLFDIKSELSYNAYISDRSLVLEVKKTNCIAWVEIPGCEYQNHIVEAKIRLENPDSYASAGIIFHIEDEDSYYLALVSSRGYFRLDAVKNNSPKTLIAWTEISDFDGTNISLNIITYGAYINLVINGKWAGEACENSANGGRLGFVMTSYETAETETSDDYSCKARLDYFSVDTRSRFIEEEFKKWSGDSCKNAVSYLRLAETFAVMGEYSKALDEINKAWKRRDDVIRSFSDAYTETRTRRELLLAARITFMLGQYNEAEGFINAFMEQWTNSAEGRQALTEKIKILNELDKFEELKEFVLKYNDFIERDIDFYTLLARCCWELNEYEASADAWDMAFEMDRENGVYAANAANAFELTGRKDEALARFLEAGKIFLNQNNLAELAALLPKLTSLGETNWEARALAGKCAFSIEDYNTCEAEFAAANKLRYAARPKPKADPAMHYLWGLVLHLKGKNRDAVKHLERAVRLAPDYGLFRLKLAEIKFLSGITDFDLAGELRLAIEHITDDTEGKMAGRAANLLLEAGDYENAEYFLGKVKSYEDN